MVVNNLTFMKWNSQLCNIERRVVRNVEGQALTSYSDLSNLRPAGQRRCRLQHFGHMETELEAERDCSEFDHTEGDTDSIWTLSLREMSSAILNAYQAFLRLCVQFMSRNAGKCTDFQRFPHSSLKGHCHKGCWASTMTRSQNWVSQSKMRLPPIATGNSQHHSLVN